MIEDSDQDKLYIAFSPTNKDSKKYADILVSEQKKMRENGELTKILAHYNITDWQK
jgi:hypothetical protein